MNEPKYKIGDEVWYMARCHQQEGTVERCHPKLDGMYLIANKDGIDQKIWINDAKLFPTKEDLIKSL